MLLFLHGNSHMYMYTDCREVTECKTEMKRYMRLFSWKKNLPFNKTAVSDSNELWMNKRNYSSAFPCLAEINTENVNPVCATAGS